MSPKCITAYLESTAPKVNALFVFRTNHKSNHISQSKVMLVPINRHTTIMLGCVTVYWKQVFVLNSYWGQIIVGNCFLCSIYTVIYHNVEDNGVEGEYQGISWFYEHSQREIWRVVYDCYFWGHFMTAREMNNFSSWEYIHYVISYVE